MFFQIIESSSSGNCSLLRYGDANILIDAGVGITKVKSFLCGLGLTPADISAIFITHEHSDHCRALTSFARFNSLQVFANRLTYECVCASNSAARNLRWTCFENGVDFPFGEILVRAFSIPHDTSDCVGYSFRCGDETIVWATDLGKATNVLIDEVRTASVLVLESNYCPRMLEASSRPYRLKERIKSSHGHLSNADAIAVLKKIDQSKIKKIFLAHVSSECNDISHIADLLMAEADISLLLDRIEIIPPKGHSSTPFEI